MRSRTFSVALCLMLLPCAVSCAATESPLSRMGPPLLQADYSRPAETVLSVQPVAEPARPAEPSADDRLRRAVDHAAADVAGHMEVVRPTVEPEPSERPVVPFDGTGPALTEALESALSRLAEAKAENQRLTDTVARLQDQVADRDQAITRLEQDLADSESVVQQMQQELREWQDDVLGFRDEMRKAEEAEMEVLREILSLLQEFKKAKEEQ